MREPLPITDLEVIGYANRLTETTRPAVVPPIFRLKSDPARIFLPPYVIQEGFVCSATETTLAELARLDGAEEATSFGQFLPASRDYELWIDEDGAPRYEPIAVAHAHLREIASRSIGIAVAALARGDDDGAKRACRTAISADDRLIEPLAIIAAIARRRNDRSTDRLMGKLAENRATPSGFEIMVKGYMGSAPLFAGETAPDLLSRHSIFGIATRRAA